MLLNAASVSSIGTSTSLTLAGALAVQQRGAHGGRERQAADLVADRLGTKAGSSSVPIADAKPDAACTISSKAGRAAQGPSCPKPVAARRPAVD